ncbi:MAG: PLP-dependent transferase [Verrucomicrobiales bacterium]|nr:PLP-dependent transferase [Verrucomicrobiales bacterium]
MRDAYTQPFCKESDLGKALPESDHAVSVCLPRWEHVIGYEEGDPAVVDTFECGYPRFVPHPFVDELFYAAQEEFAKKNEVALVFPSLAAAWRCAEYVKRRSGASCRLESYGWEGLTVVLLSEEYYGAAWKYWQHSGEIVSSREAESALMDEPVDEAVVKAGHEASAVIRERIASFYPGVEGSDVFLFSSGMAAVAAVHRVIAAAGDDAPTLQIEFPYLDSFKLQEQFGGGVVDLSVTESGGVAETREWLGAGNAASAVFTELPSNPLLRTADLAGISPLLKEHGIPLVVDDTIATSVNVDPFRFADVVTTSLTKIFSGAGDVAAGAVVLKSGTTGYEMMKEALPSEESASPLFVRDAIVLEFNSRHYEERVRATNEIAEAVFGMLSNRPEIESLWHPSTQCRERYDQLRKPDGGYGALISFVLKGGEEAAKKFYDVLEISKGPSLGTDFSLICPYTLLAHYGELEWAAARGAGRHLLRVWIGLEDPDDLLNRFTVALNSL